MSTLNKYAAAARCIRRQRVLKKNAAAYIKLAAEGDTASQEAKKRRRSRLLRGLGIGAGLAGLGGLAYYHWKKHPGLVWKSRSDVSKEKSSDEVLATPLPGDPKPGNLPLADPKNPVTLPEFAARLALDKAGLGRWPISEDNMRSIADSIDYAAGAFLRDIRDPKSHQFRTDLRRVLDIPGYTFKQRAADAKRYALATEEERERRQRRALDGYAVPYMLADLDNSDAASSYHNYEQMIDYEGLNTPHYVPGSGFLLPDVDYLPITYVPDVKPSWGTRAIQAREAAELEAFEKKYPE